MWYWIQCAAGRWLGKPTTGGGGDCSVCPWRRHAVPPGLRGYGGGMDATPNEDTIAKGLPVAAFLGTDIPQLGELLRMNMQTRSTN